MRTYTQEQKKRKAERKAEWQRAWWAGLTPEQREAARLYQREWNASRTPEQRAKKSRDASVRNIARRLGITTAEYHHLIESSHGRCAICGVTANGKSLCIDHDHATGAVRGVLCGKCNSVLGLADDDPHRLRLAADYLEQCHRVAAA